MDLRRPTRGSPPITEEARGQARVESSSNEQFQLDTEPLCAASPIVHSECFRRLSSISFLGSLSPRHWDQCRPPVVPPRQSESPTDGSRAAHSIGVARLSDALFKKLGLSYESRLYAVVWALLHDLATWPLSHTGEAAFADATGVSSSHLRRMMIQGTPQLPEHLQVPSALAQIDLSTDVLLSLFDKDSARDLLAVAPSSLRDELRIVWTVIHSPLTPDTVEGICRVGRAYGVDVPDPEDVLDAISSAPTLFGTVVQAEHSRPVLTFWRVKSRLYRRFINCDPVVHWESACSKLIREHFGDLPLDRSLGLPEAVLVDLLASTSDLDCDEVVRYKSPRIYSVATNHKRKRLLGRDVLLSEIAQILLSTVGEDND